MRFAFGATVSIILIAIYVYLVYFGIDIIYCAESTTCTNPDVSDFNESMASTLALIGGLVSALVIAELAITNPGDVPGARLLAAGVNKNSIWPTILKVVVGAYILVWLAAGAASFVIGYLQHPNALEPLSSLGQAWLGIAVGAGYAYLGINK